MKKIIYSKITKLIIALIFIASVTLGSVVVSNGIVKFFSEEIDVYNFESDFSKTGHFTHLLHQPESAVYNAYCEYFDLYYREDEAPYNDEYFENFVPKTNKSLLNIIEENLNNNTYYEDKINYYVSWNGFSFTNCDAKNETDILNSEFNLVTRRDENGEISQETTQYNDYYANYTYELLSEFDKTSEITIATSVKDEYVEKCKTIWHRQQKVVFDTFTFGIVLILVALASLIYLICTCGKNKDGEYNRIWIDNIFAEVHLALMGACGVGGVALVIAMLDACISDNFPYNLAIRIIPVVAGLVAIVVITSLLSLIRNAKCKNFINSSIIGRVLRWIFKLFKKVFLWTYKVFLWTYKGIKDGKEAMFTLFSQKTGVIFISALFVYTAVIGLCGIFTPEIPIALLLGIAIFLFAGFMLAYCAKDIDEIKKGASEIRKGNLIYKIPELKSKDMKNLATDINDIGKGLDESVLAKLKAERLKTDLITNVSHDLKTPLTSIISYTELLSKVENLPEEARDYIGIISNKSDRLKKLTQDLFDISKAQSGNEEVNLERLDVALLINQSLGENDNEISKSNIPFCVNIEKELYILADGRKMSRVIGNLIGNILKYSLTGTRAFIEAQEKDGYIEIWFKNISSYPMEFDEEEIIGRFVRGDESRTIEGNGLGLAIAKTYTELCGGSFNIVIDGDMFKAQIKFTKHSEQN